MALWLLVLAALGADRVHHAVDEGLGLPVGATTAVAQDARGFVWAGTQAGAARFDGDRYEPVGLDVFSGWVEDLAPLPDGRMMVAGIGGPYVFDGASARPDPIAGAGRVRDLCVDPDGGVMAADGQQVFVDGPGRWRALTVPPGVRPLHVRCEQGRRFVLAADALWELTGPALQWRRLLSVPLGPVDAVVDGDGSLWVLPSRGALLHVVDGETDRIPLPDGRHVDLLLRRASLWVSSVYALTVVRPDGAVETLDRDDGWRSHGVLALGADGGLWVATKAGLDLFPEPDTAHFDRDDGLADELVRRVSRDGPRVWASGWNGFSSVGPRGVRAYVPVVRGTVCVRDGEMWGVGQDYRPQDPSFVSSLLVHAVDGEVRVSPGLAGSIGNSCALDDHGQPWTSAGGHLYRIEGDRLVEGPALPEAGGELHASSPDPATVPGSLWWLSGERACRFAGGDWQCADVDGAEELTDVLDRPDGSTWLASRHRGVVALRWGSTGGATVTSLGMPVASGVDRVLRLAPSPRGGVWINGVGFTVRARHDGDGWEILERLRFAEGLDHGTQAEILELDDGTLWVASYADLIRMPASARQPPVDDFPLVVRQLTAGGEPVEEENARLPWRADQLTLRLAALTFRDRRSLQYRVRLGPDDPWLVQPTGTFQFAQLAPGSYLLQAQGSSDGLRWTPPIRRSVTIASPPWLRWWAWLSYLGLAGGLAYAVHTARVRRALAVDRERRRIALDLHDELGSGLGSIGLGAGLLAGTSLPDAARSELAERLGKQARDMSTALSEIVWSLRQGPVTVSALFEELELRGRALLVDGRAELFAEPPALDAPVLLSSALARGVLLIGLEALHNAARHAQADTIRLRLVVEGGRGLLEVADDGVGFQEHAPTAGGGNGLGSMKRRADRIGARLEVVPGPRGTVVRVTFDCAGAPET